MSTLNTRWNKVIDDLLNGGDVKIPPMFAAILPMVRGLKDEHIKDFIKTIKGIVKDFDDIE